MQSGHQISVQNGSVVSAQIITFHPFRMFHRTLRLSSFPLLQASFFICLDSSAVPFREHENLFGGFLAFLTLGPFFLFSVNVLKATAIVPRFKWQLASDPMQANGHILTHDNK